MTANLEMIKVGRRTLAFAQWGDPSGAPVFSLHGTPGSRMGRPPDEDAVRAAGLRVITYDRPGYGQSDRHAGRRIVDCVGDIAAIADAIGLDRFHVTGGSGGAPHALATSARLADRVIAVEAAVCPVPYGTPDFDWFAGMDPANIREFGWAMAGERTLHEELTAYIAKMLDQVDAGRTDDALVDFDLDEADRAVMARADVQQVMAEMMREAFATGPWGWVDDDLALIEPWGFDVTDIATPVKISYGSTDVLVPAAHGAWLAEHVPNARVAVSEAGHLVTPEERIAEMVDLIRSS